MEGYTDYGYVAIVNGQEMIFATEEEYLDYLKETEYYDN